MISIITCSINPIFLANLKANIEQTINIDHEIVSIDNRANLYSIAQAYNLGAEVAIYPYLCFVHEDIIFHTCDWGTILINYLKNEDISLIGILGTVIKTRATSGVYIPNSPLNRINQLQRTATGATCQYYENPLNDPFSEVKILDGMFLATTKLKHSKSPFDDQLLTGFHGYDIDYSLGQAKNGKVIVIYDILIEHFSYGGNTRQWINQQIKVTKKWRETLPQSIGLKKNEILQAEIINIEVFLNTLYKEHTKKRLQFKYLCRLLFLRPFASKNIYFIKKFLIYGQLEHLLKKLKYNYKE
jgi:hypothetical protein